MNGAEAEIPNSRPLRYDVVVNRLLKISIFFAALNLLLLAGDSSARIRGSGGADQIAPNEKVARESRIAYLKKHAIPISSIDADKVDFADLQLLRKAIGGRRASCRSSASSRAATARHSRPRFA